MLALEFVPKWFNGYSFVVFEFFSAIVLFLISIYAYKCYKFNKSCNNKNLAIAFLLMSLAFIAKISTNIIIHYNIIETINIGLFNIVYESTKGSNIFFIVGYFFYKFLMLIGLYILYLTLSKSNENILFLIYFIMITTIFSTSAYYVFHMTVFLFSIYISKIYYKNYLNNKKKPVFCLFFAFLLIAISQIFFIFSIGKQNIYVLSEIIQLIGFIFLLYVFIKTIKNAKKK